VISKALRSVLPIPALIAGGSGLTPPLEAQEVEGAGVGDRISLRLAGSVGQTLPYLHDKRLSLRLPAELGGEATTRTRLRLDQRIESRGPDSIVIGSEIREFRFDVQPRPDQLPDLSRMEGLRFRSTATRSGRIYRIEIEGASGPVEKAMRDQVENWLRELGFPTLPPGPVRIGESWTDTTRVPLSALLGLQGESQAVEIRTTRLASIEPGSERPEARLEVETRWTDDGEAPAPDVSVRGASTQIVRFDIDAGVFLDSRGTSRIRVEIGSGTGVAPLRIEAEGSYETRLIAPG
jgi:hypothetical protein